MPIAIIIALLGCGADAGPGERTAGLSYSGGLGDAGNATTGSTASATAGSEAESPPGGGDGDTGGEDPTTQKFDVAPPSVCTGKPPGLVCEDNRATLCDGAGEAESSTLCTPETCVPGEGCITCFAGEWSCKGPRVMACNTDGVAYWEEIEICDPASSQYCDVSVQGCSTLAPIGSATPSGEYYQYSTFSPAVDGFVTVTDVDSFDNRIWFVGHYEGKLSVGAYDVALLDTDADGVLEPHQHPDSKEQQGVIEERVFTFVETFEITNDGAHPHQMELYATATTLTWGGPQQITQYDLMTEVKTQVAAKPPWLAALPFPNLSFLGYDDVNRVWYSGSESARRVFQYDEQSMTWGYAFEYPVLAGDHMDGLEVVTDSKGVPYVYVSDMLSNYIGQYRHHHEEGWVQTNLFEYAEANGAPVEGMGFGANNHFWIGANDQDTFYEIGGGDLTKFLEPEG
ncbi:MAG: hypothetical protein AAF721_35930 [Myxococcota bacterium]